MQVLFFSFCNIKIVALINSLLKPPSALLSNHTHVERRLEEEGGGREREREREGERKRWRKEKILMKRLK